MISHLAAQIRYDRLMFSSPKDFDMKCGHFTALALSLVLLTATTLTILYNMNQTQASAPAAADFTAASPHQAEGPAAVN